MAMYVVERSVADQRASYGGFLSPPMTQILGPRRGREKVKFTLSPANLVVVLVCETSGDAYGSLAAAEIFVGAIERCGDDE
jgi:hypothetical protein